jgi:hypothetical protein
MTDIFTQGIECCSTSVISFHYIDEKMMTVFNFLTYYMKLFTNTDDLPPKLNFEEIKLKLNEEVERRNLESSSPETTIPESFY